MRKILVATVAAVVLSGGALLADRSEAMTLTAPAGARAAIDHSAVEQIRHRCYRTWRNGRWRLSCPSHVVRRHYYGSPYYGYRPYRNPYAYYPYRHRRSGVGVYFRF
jgi:hypothetical protein